MHDSTRLGIAGSLMIVVMILNIMLLRDLFAPVFTVVWTTYLLLAVSAICAAVAAFTTFRFALVRQKEEERGR